MTIFELAALIAAIALSVLIAYVVPLLIQFRKTLAETGELLARTKEDLPPLITEMRSMSQSVCELSEQLGEGVEHANAFLHAVGEVGETVHQVNSTVRGTSGMLLANVASLLAGVRAASAFIKRNSDR